MYRHEDNTITTDDAQVDDNALGGLGRLFFKYMKKHHDKIAQIDTTTHERDTFGNLLQKSVRMGIMLKKKGIKRGDIITYYSKSHINAAVPMIASFFIGSIPSFLDVILPVIEVTHLLKTLTPKLLLTDDEYFESLENIVEDAGINTSLIVLNEEFYKHQDREEEFKPVYVNDLKELVAIFFSSGSNGLPKGICLNHHRFLISDVTEDDSFWKKGQEKVILSCDSFYWSTEMTRLIVSIRTGACRLLVPDQTDPERIWYTFDKYKVNHAELYPYKIIKLCMLGKPKDVNLGSLLTVVVEGALLPKQFELLFRKVLPATDIFQPYGMTEVGLLLAFTKCDIHKAYSKKKIGSVGLPVAGSGISYKVVDLRNGKNLGPNTEGHLLVKSRCTMLGYYNLDSSDQFDEDGWFKTGDLAYYDEDLCFFITGRIKDVITYQGWHVNPASLEEELLTHYAVVRAVVVGIPDLIDGERPLGLVTLKVKVSVSADEIEKFVNIRAPNQPLKVKIVNDLPTTATGKVKRHKVKELILTGEI